MYHGARFEVSWRIFSTNPAEADFGKVFFLKKLILTSMQANVMAETPARYIRLLTNILGWNTKKMMFRETKIDFILIYNIFLFESIC